MGNNRLLTNDTPEVALCEWHLRKVFWDERLLSKLQQGELKARYGEIKLRRNPTVSSSAPYNQEFVLFDPVSNEEIARCHQLLEADKTTLAGSGFPDPKQVNINGIDYHQLSKGNPQCKHCEEGVPTDYEKII